MRAFPSSVARCSVSVKKIAPRAIEAPGGSCFVKPENDLADCQRLPTLVSATTAAGARITSVLSTRLCFIDTKCPPIGFFLVQSLNRGSCFRLIGHLNKGETTRASGLPIRDNPYLTNITIRLKELC